MSPRKVREVIAASRRGFSQEGVGLFLAHEREGGTFVGFTGLRRSEETGEVELLYGLWPAFSGRGLARDFWASFPLYSFTRSLLLPADEHGAAVLCALSRRRLELGQAFSRGPAP